MNESSLIRKRKIIIVFLSLFCALSFSKAQTIWNKTYFEDRPSMRFSSVLSSDTCYNVIGVTVNNIPPSYEQALTVQIDVNGLLLNYKSTPDTTGINTGLFWNTLIRTNTGGLAFAGYGADTTQHLLLGFADKRFDSIQLYRYHTSNTFAFQGSSLPI